MNTWDIRKYFKQYNIQLPYSIRLGSYINRVKLYQTETYSHFLTKALVSKYLFNKGYTILSEYPIQPDRRPDILAIKLLHEPLIVEIETNINKTHKDIGIDTITLESFDFSNCIYETKLNNYFKFYRKEYIPKRTLI